MENADVLQLFDLKETHEDRRENDVVIEVKGETSLMYQIVARHFAALRIASLSTKPVLDVSGRLRPDEAVNGRFAEGEGDAVRYNGDQPTYQVIVDLGIPPGFTVDAGDFAEMGGGEEGRCRKFSA